MKTEVVDSKEVTKKGPFVRLTDAFNGNTILMNIDAMYFIRRKATEGGKLVTFLTLRDRSVEVGVSETPEEIWSLL